MALTKHVPGYIEGLQARDNANIRQGKQYLDDDSVFAVKDQLTVDFVPRKGDPEAKLELTYDITLAPADSEGESNVPLASSGAGSQ